MKKACTWAKQYGPLVGRLLLSNLFIVSGFKKLTGFAYLAIMGGMFYIIACGPGAFSLGKDAC